MIADLASRVEREVPSRELDAEIALAIGLNLGTVNGRTFAEAYAEYRQRDIAGLVRHFAVPHYTTSRDAAAGLMPAGWIVWEIGQDTDTQHWYAHLMDRRDSGIDVRASAPTEPQARTAAALRAMAEEHNGKPT